ncbi:MAG: glycosyltransferase family 2 protein [Thermodesulfobacteriota bacterium]
MNSATKPLVSVIVPTFNRAGMVVRAVESVLAQTFRDMELIVVDDGSTDETRLALSRMQPGFRVHYQENQGVSAARNRGVALSTGRFLAFLDSDDLWLPEKLFRQVAFFEDHPEAMICQTEEVWIRRGKRVNPKNRHRKPSGMIFFPSLSLCLVSPSAVMLKRELFEEMGGFDETLPACEDYDLWLRIGCRYPIYLLDEPLIVKQGGHEDQLSARDGLDRFRIQSLVKILETEPLTRDQFRAAVDKLQEKCAIYAGGCLRRGRDREAAWYRELAHAFASARCPQGDPAVSVPEGDKDANKSSDTGKMAKFPDLRAENAEK